MTRDYVNSADAVCYICSEVTFARPRKSTTAVAKKAYISVARYATKTNSGPHIYAAVNVQQIFAVAE
jgi:hypothetical protein